MRILFDNVLLDYDTISSTNESESYPASNLLDDFLKIRYRFSYGTSDEITIELLEDESIDTVFWSFTNCTEITFRLYDVYDTKLASHTFTDLSNDCGAYHFSRTLTTVRRVVIEVTTTGDGGYLGGIAAGVDYDFGNPGASWDEPQEDNSVVVGSPTGQSLQSYYQPSNIFSWLFRDRTLEEKNEVKNMYRTYGRGYHVWVHPFEDNDDFIPPFYGILNEIIIPKKNGRRYDYQLSVKEAK